MRTGIFFLLSLIIGAEHETEKKKSEPEYSQKFLESLFDDAMFPPSPEKHQPVPAKKVKVEKDSKDSKDKGLPLKILCLLCISYTCTCSWLV